MELRPILSTLRRHKTAASLIVLEIALSCAIICNALFLISQRLDNINRPSGFDETHIVRVQVGGVDIPHQFISMLPYAATLLVMMFALRWASVPAFLGRNYDRESRH